MWSVVQTQVVRNDERTYKPPQWLSAFVSPSSTLSFTPQRLSQQVAGTMNHYQNGFTANVDNAATIDFLPSDTPYLLHDYSFSPFSAQSPVSVTTMNVPQRPWSARPERAQNHARYSPYQMPPRDDNIARPTSAFSHRFPRPTSSPNKHVTSHMLPFCASSQWSPQNYVPQLPSALLKPPSAKYCPPPPLALTCALCGDKFRAGAVYRKWPPMCPDCERVTPQ